MTDEERAKAAERLLKDPIWPVMVKHLQQAALDALIATDFADKEQREILFFQARALEELTPLLRNWAKPRA